MNERKFTKITDEALQKNPLVMCINNENPKLYSFEDEYSVIARSYQNLYDNCLNSDKKLMSVPEVQSKIRNISSTILLKLLLDIRPITMNMELYGRGLKWPVGYSRKIRLDEDLNTWECATVLYL